MVKITNPFSIFLRVKVHVKESLVEFAFEYRKINQEHIKEFLFSEALFFIMLAIGVKEVEFDFLDVVNLKDNLDILIDLVPGLSRNIIRTVDFGLIYLQVNCQKKDLKGLL